MNSPAAAQPLFAWSARREGAGWLTFWVFVGLAIHAVGFLLIRPEYPPVEPGNARSATLVVAVPGSRYANSLKAPLQSLDPALYAPERSSSYTTQLPATPRYEPTFRKAVPPPDPMPESAPTIKPPVVELAGAVPVADEPSAPSSFAAGVPPPAADTRIVLGESLRARTVLQFSRSNLRAGANDQLCPAEYLIAVEGSGEVRHVVELRGSGNASLDRAAAQALTAMRVSPSDPSAALQWGFATFLWGNDIIRPSKP